MRSTSAWLVVSIILILIFALAPEPILEQQREERTVPDLPIPPSPPCPEGSECAQVRTCDPTSEFSPPILNQEWNVNGSFRIFSSPNLVDLNKDGILDVVSGMGVEEDDVGGVIALDGKNGSHLWQSNASGELFATAQFKDLNNDGHEDVVLGGRSHQLLAVDGITGETIWTFDEANNGTNNDSMKWFQFYTGQFIPDRNGDGIEDWLTSNGGDPYKLPGEPRSNGFMMIISGALDDVVSIALFGVFLGLAFSSGTSLALSILQGPIEILLGLVYGIFVGVVLWYFPPRDSVSDRGMYLKIFNHIFYYHCF